MFTFANISSNCVATIPKFVAIVSLQTFIDIYKIAGGQFLIVYSFYFGLGNKNSLKCQENSLKKLKTVHINSPGAYIRKGLLLEGYLLLWFGGIIFGRAYLFIYLFMYLFIY